MPETWKQVIEYDMYDVSNKGQVRSWHNYHQGRRKIPRLLTPTPDHHNYPLVSLWDNGQRRTFRVHRLVLDAFISRCPENMECCHNDGDPTNNHLENLRWDTHFNNAQDAIKHGTTAHGERSGRSKLTEAQVIEIRQVYAAGYITQKELGARYGVSHDAVSEIVNYKKWLRVP